MANKYLIKIARRLSNTSVAMEILHLAKKNSEAQSRTSKNSSAKKKKKLRIDR